MKPPSCDESAAARGSPSGHPGTRACPSLLRDDNGCRCAGSDLNERLPWCERQRWTLRMPAEIYGWSTEGFDTHDLQEAKALLEEFHGN